MSAIFGLYNLDQRPVAPQDLQRMSDILAHRGSDGAHTWVDGNVGLGHRMLWTTPESLHEHLPLNEKSSGLAITADARIDNREELYALLEMGKPLAELSDSELLLAAYVKWGERCPERLLGDFAFAVWDGRSHKIFCARDHFGVKPFYYYLSNQAFVFASEIKALFSTACVPRRLNEIKVGDYLAGVFQDKTTTFYQDVLLLPAGHCIAVGPASSSLRCFYSLDPSTELRLNSNEEYAEAFREHFTEAVRCRLRSAFPVGSMLSGGLDSSSITCVARNLLTNAGRESLNTFSFIFDKAPMSDERDYFNTVIAQGGLTSYLIQGDELGPLSDLDRVHWHEDNPVWTHGVYLFWATYGAAKEQGVRVMLDGHDGDGTVSHGFKYLDELAQAGRWLSLTLEAKGLGSAYEQLPAPGVIKEYFEHYKLKPFMSRHPSLKLIQRSWRRGAALFGDKKSKAKSGMACFTTINPDFTRRMHLTDRYRAARKGWPNFARNTKDEHYRMLTSGLQSWALEAQDSVGAAFSQEVRYPFWDKRLVEFCLSLPGEQKRCRGWDRVVMRRAMAGILPPEIQWRRHKSDFTDGFSYSLFSLERDRLNRLVENDSDLIAEYLNMAAVREVCSPSESKLSSESAQERCARALSIWRAVALAAWLKHSWTTG